MIRPRGKVDAKYVVVGDAPNDEEVQENKSFVGKTYDLMSDLLKKAGYPVEDCLFVNCVTYQKYLMVGPLTAEEIIKDADRYLIPLIEKHPRTLIIGLGNNALCALGVTQKPAGINALKFQRLESELLPGIPVVAATHPYAVLKEPEDAGDLLTDLRFGQRILKGDRDTQVPLHIVDLEAPNDLNQLFIAVERNPYMAYDIEATALDRDYAVPVTMAFANGLQTAVGEETAWYWAGYEKLRPRYEAHILEQFREGFIDFFGQAGDLYTGEVWNHGYEDWVLESLAAKKFPQESFAEWKQYGRVRGVLPGAQDDGLIYKWVVDNRIPHNLKHTTSLVLGYPDYDRAVDEYVSNIAKRRGKLLTEDEDFYTLEWLGIDPIKTKKGYKWPPKLDKKTCAYALLPYDLCRLYNCYDAVYTHLNIIALGDQIEKDGLSLSCEFRHQISKEFLLAEQRGMLCDVETNRKFSVMLEQTVNRCNVSIQQELENMGHDLPDFNANSSKQLIKILFGEPVRVPFIDRGNLYVGKDRDTINTICDMVEKQVYGDTTTFPSLTKLVLENKPINLEAIEEKLRSLGLKKLGKQVRLYRDDVYLRGLYEPVGFTKGGQPSTGGVAMQALFEKSPNPLLKLILMQRRASKLKETFIDGIYAKLYEDNTLHPNWRATGTNTGRSSSSNPNGQNFIKAIRGQLIPRPGYKFLEYDLAQAEVRGIAAESGDPALIAAVNSDYDIHRAVASNIYRLPVEEIDDEKRRQTKTIVFGILYGMSAFRLALALGITQEEAERFIEDFLNAYPVLRLWMENQVKIASTAPYYVSTPWGTRRSTRNILSIDKKMVRHTSNVAVNMPIQGGAGETCFYFICRAMSEIRRQGLDAHLVNQVHDSVCKEVSESLAWFGDVIDDMGTREILGPVPDIVRKVVDAGPPFKKWRKVKWKMDLELTDYWAGKPDLMKALDPSKERDRFIWSLIDPTSYMDAEELAELREMELEATGVCTF